MMAFEMIGVLSVLAAADAGSEGSPAEHLAALVRVETVTFDEQPAAPARFAELRAVLDASYPSVHRALEKEIVNESSLLYTWQGQDPKAPAVLFMAHQDVVPVAPDSESAWAHAPFSGDIADGFVWGRGTWDDKGNLVAMLEAVERLSSRGFKPKGTVYFAFGHDEEAGRAAGEQGAKHLAALLSARGVHLAAVIDEGLLVTHDSIKGIDAPVALIGIAEKGYVTLELTTEAESGHSSMPPERTAIGTLATALSRLEHTPFEPQLTPAVRQMLATLAPHFGGLQGFAVSHLGVFEGSVLKKLAASPAGNAMTRSTFALTTIHAGNKDNVLPASAKAHVNVRTLTGTSAEDVKRHVRDAIGDDSVSIVVLKGSLDASPLSSATSAFYANIAKSVTDTFQGALVAPGLMLGATDARHFVGLADDVYRFSPVHAWPKDLTRFHGVDERLSVENLNQMVQFYESLLRRL